MNRPSRLTPLLAALLCLETQLGEAVETGGAALPTYSAIYSVEYGGRVAGTSKVFLRYDQERNVYEFSSTIELQGAYKLLVPGEITSRSEFSFSGGDFVPLSYWSSDGKRGGQAEHVIFDWVEQTATSGSERLGIEQGLLDLATLRPALMYALSTNNMPHPRTIYDDGEMRTYNFDRAESQLMETPIGPIEAELIIQARSESSKKTLFWVAREMCYLPIEIAQENDGTSIRFLLKSVDGIRLNDGACRV